MAGDVEEAPPSGCAGGQGIRGSVRGLGGPDAGMCTRHLAAGFGAAAADVGTAPHDVVVGDGVAAPGAGFAGLGADATSQRVQVRIAQHEMSACLAHLGAIQEGANVIRRGVPATFLKAVSEGLGANPVALQTFLDALLHIHDGSPSLDFQSSDENEPAGVGVGLRVGFSAGAGDEAGFRSECLKRLGGAMVRLLC